MGAEIRLVGGTDLAGGTAGNRRGKLGSSVRKPLSQSNRQRFARAVGTDRLSDKAIAAWVKRGAAGKLFDGGGLFLFAPSGVPRWYVKYRHGGKPNTYTLGRYGAGADEYTIAKARAERATVKAWLAKGLNPNIEKKAEKARASAIQGETFEKLANDWYAKASAAWTSKKHIAGRRRLLDNDLLPDLGAHPVADLAASPQTALLVLQKIEARGAHEMAAKARTVGSMICRYGIITGRMTQDPFAYLGQALKRPPVVNRATVELDEMPDLFEKLAAVPAELNTKLAFYFQIATCVRPGEVRFAPWSEIKGDKWKIAPERMKMRNEFVQPLSPLAIKILERARELRQSGEPDELIFPGFTRHGALSENAFLALLARAGYFGRQTAHGFRASFSTWAHEIREADPDVIEACLAHVKEGVRGIYNRASYFARRRELLEAWGDQLKTWGMKLP
jgi:integrase